MSNPSFSVLRASLLSLSDDSSSCSLSAGLAQEMARRWRQGERPLAESFLNRHPELWEEPEAALDLLYEEICLRHEMGDEDAAAAVLARFPQWRTQLQMLLECHRMLEPAAREPRFPEVGTTVLGYHLIAELGRGGQGRVFLATQPDLADRPVVVKFTPCRGTEHQALARLQHTHIVPLYTVHEEPARNLRVLCMPYFGGTTLARVLEAVRLLPLAQRTGQHILDVLDRTVGGTSVGGTGVSPVYGDIEVKPIPGRLLVRQSLAVSGYVQAVCWIGAALADALQFAHERGLVHLDLKPSNVLLAADGLPMLLDFHLAREPVRPDHPRPDWLGGTPAYMAPEQKAAITALRAGQPIPAVVDERSDVYSLGLVLYEALGGVLPLPEKKSPARLLRRLGVSVGLSDLIGKCLAPDPRRRYGSAGEVAADLKRHNRQELLHGVRNRSLLECWHKWRHHHSLLVAIPKVVIALLAVLGLVLWGYQVLRTENQQLKTLTEREDDRQRVADRQETIRQLHALMEQTRLLDGVEDRLGLDEVVVEWRCRQMWEKVPDLLAWLKKDQREARPTGSVEESVRMDLFDLAFFLSDLRLRRKTGGTPVPPQAAREQALRVLDEAEERLGSNAALCRQRERLARELGQDDVAGRAALAAAKQPPRTAWEHAALGRVLMRAGQLHAAWAELAAAIRMGIRSPWPHFQAGACAYRLKRYEDAVLAFTSCLALAPPSSAAACYCNRARCYAAGGRLDRALFDYNAAIHCDRHCAAAYRGRGLVNRDLGRRVESERDLRRAEKMKPSRQ